MPKKDVIFGGIGAKRMKMRLLSSTSLVRPKRVEQVIHALVGDSQENHFLKVAQSMLRRQLAWQPKE
jgi:hypothetical protein